MMPEIPIDQTGNMCNSYCKLQYGHMRARNWTYASNLGMLTIKRVNSHGGMGAGAMHIVVELIYFLKLCRERHERGIQ